MASSLDMIISNLKIDFLQATYFTFSSRFICYSYNFDSLAILFVKY